MIPGITASRRRGGGVVPVPTNVDAMSVASKLISWWDFDGNANDLHSANSLSGTASYSAGLINQKATKTSRLSKTSAVLPQAMTTAEGTGGLSFGGWVYIAGTGGEDIEVRTAGGEAYRIAVRNGNQAHFVCGSTGTTTISSSVGAVSVGNWYLLVATINPVTRAMRLYVNGSSVATGTATSMNMNNPDALSFGRVTGDVFTALQNDSSFVTNAVLTANDVAWLYSSGTGHGSADLPQARNGVWTWYNDPRVILLPSGRLLAGVVENDGIISLNWTDDGGLTTTRNALSGTTSPDDHDNPALLRRSDGKLLFFSARHNASSYNVGISAAADDPSSFSVTDIASSLGGGPFSYANPFELTGESGSPILNFFRSGTSPTWSVYYSRSTDGGVTWGGGVRLLDGASGSGRPYLKACKNGSARIDFAVTDGSPAAVATNSIRHFYYQGGAFYTSNGTPLGSAPYDTATDLTTVYDGTTDRAWIHDIKIGSDGHPRVVFAVFPTTTDHRYFYGRWTGSAWVTNEICTAGGPLYAAETYYSGGACLDGDDPSIVYASRGMGGGRWALYKYVTSDGGSTFSETDLGLDGIRPFHIKGAGMLAAVNGRYVTYNNYRTRVALLGVGS